MRESNRAFLYRADRGAVMVESLVAIPTLLAFFAMILQLSYLSIASLVVQHAAVSAARSASVIIPDDPFAFSDRSDIGKGEGDRLATITDAANSALKALQPLPLQGKFNPNATVKLMKSGTEASDFEAEDIIQAEVDYDFQCGVLFGGSLICGTSGTVTLTGLAAMPNQGAEYGYY
jgi:hypothetical protein